MNPVTLVKVAAEMRYWMLVPELVRGRYKEARSVQDRVKKIIKHLPLAADYGYVFWHPDRKALHVVLSDSDNDHTHSKWVNALKLIPGVTSVTSEAEVYPKDHDDWIMIKKGSSLSWLGKPFEWGGKLTGGVSPLSNALVGGMLAGGLGYGTGYLMERLAPEEYLERGRLSKVLGALGAGLGTSPGIWQGMVANRQATEAGQPLGFFKSMATPTEKIPSSPQARLGMHNAASTAGPQGGVYDEETGRVVTAAVLDRVKEALAGCPEPPERFLKATAVLCKTANGPFAEGGGVGLRPVPMDAFNRAIWNDVQMGMTASRNPFGSKSPWGDNTQALHTPPQLGAVTSGLVTGLSEMYGGRSVLSPRHFVNGLAAAGLDTVTARLVGGTLGALGGLTPEAQRQLQNMGMWGGLIRGTVGSMLER